MLESPDMIGTSKHINIDEINALALKLKSDHDNDDVQEFYRQLSVYALTLFPRVYNEHDRQDLAQEACIRAAKSFKTFDPIRGDYTALFCSICQRVGIDALANRSCLKRTPEHGKIVSLDQSADCASDAAMEPVNQLIGKEAVEGRDAFVTMLLGEKSPLSKQQRAVLNCQFQGLTIAETANALGISCDVASSSKHSALVKAKQMLELPKYRH